MDLTRENIGYLKPQAQENLGIKETNFTMIEHFVLRKIS